VSSGRSELARIVGFGLVALVFAVTQPFVLLGLPLALLLVAFGPRDVRSAIAVAAILMMALLGDRSGLWWFERGWPLLLAGMFVTVTGWRPDWNFSAQSLAALAVTFFVASAIFVASPGAWMDVDTLMDARATQAADTALALLGSRVDDTVQFLMRKVAGLQVALFPALLAVSSLGALGVAVTVRSWLAGEAGRAFGRLRGFRFNDHLVWVWLLGLVLIVAPIGQVADRVGGNAVFFMGMLYVLRGMAVLLSLFGGISVLAGVTGAIVALLVYPLLAFVLTVALVVGLGDTWLNLRTRIERKGEER
jgi:hypothetical protein